ncbi:MAG: DUF547 domain-containing protein [Candidatus Bathyarchaeota archaeon]|nr:MAG: DUF547 domain-containing protein [Candidatus Bathyarchaeota archaeon]
MSKAAPLIGRLNAALASSINDEGRVDYSLLERSHTIEEFSGWLVAFDRKSLESVNEKIVFWINAYNMLVISSVIERLRKNPKYARTGNQGRLQRLRFFYKTKHEIGGKKYSFGQIEKILRSALDPRVHFAMCCASLSCPNLRKQLYTVEHLDMELDEAARMFVRSPKGLELHEGSRSLRLSPIFDWFKKDFEIESGGVLSFVEKYLEKDRKGFLKANRSEMKVSFLPYDWGLNIKSSID